ncbi:uncharacterized protein J4E88_008629 [Alternaria novae-zelandiae]|uniref:uncharacterized protein n=1 Tax=Alternaria novae-zelandiae TaxID=430562 RepID=UPI0020C4C38A|nr:uncharacterized protein J4E88_008629 [Alternaria novae-zelandiae]KAI4673574.1 hypothetical protein J4E88_008629 [Alternaria novae-zelandiae]
MTKNAKVISPAQATSTTQTTSWEWSAPYFVKRAQEVQARLDLQRQTMENLQNQHKDLRNQNRDLQDQNKNQKKDHERELNTCIGTFIVVWTGLTHGQILSIILENNKIQARYNENYRAWSKEEDRRFWSSYSSKYSLTPTPTPARFSENYRAWNKKESDGWWEQWNAQEAQEAQRKSKDQKFWSSWSSQYATTPTPTPAR